MGLLPKNHVALAKQSRLRPMEAQFANGASIGMIFATFKGDEEVALGRLTPDGLLKFKLPGDTPAIGLDLGQGMQELEPQLHTVSIRPDDMELDLIWRGAQGLSRLRLAVKDDQARGGCSMSAPMAEGASGVSAAERGGERTLLPGQSPAGEYILSVLIKRTYRIVPERSVRAC